MSAITIKDAEDQPIKVEPKRRVFDPEVQIYIQELITQATTQAMAISSSMMNKALAEFEAKLATIETPKSKIMQIQINDLNIKKLSVEAVPYLPRMIINAKMQLNTMLVGPAGSGKTFAAHQLAEALGLEFSHINCTAGMSETWLAGRHTPLGFLEASFAHAYEHGGVFLMDEIDAAGSNVLMLLQTAIENGHFYNPMTGKTLARHKDFVMIAAANTVGKGADGVYTARERQDAAFLSRFIQIRVDYNREIERVVCPDSQIRSFLWTIREKLLAKGGGDFISTRDLKQTYQQYSAGVSMRDIIDSMSLKWNKANIELLKEFDEQINSWSANETKPSATPTMSHETLGTEAKDRSEKVRAEEEELARLMAENAKLKSSKPKLEVRR